MIYLVSTRPSFFHSNLYKEISVEESIQLLAPLSEIGNDTETSGLSCHTKKLLLLQLGNEQFQILYDIESFNYIIPQKLKDFMNNYNGIWILQNAKFDLQFFYKQGIILKRIYDTMLAETIITLGLQKGGRDLKTITQKYCDVTLNKDVRGEIITTGLSDRVLIYAANDIKFLPLIKKKQEYYIKGNKLQQAVLLDNNFVKVLAYIEYCGIKLDWDKWKVKAQENYDNTISTKHELESYFYESGGKKYFQQLDLFSELPLCSINWDSAQQVIPVFESLGINCTIKEKGVEKKSIEKKALKFQIPDHKILQLYFKYKDASKQSSTYGFKWKNMINPTTGRIHTTFRQIMNTGRLSCGDSDNNQPNLQNLPNDAYTRSCFVAESGNKYAAVDYSAQESIVLANFANDESLIAFYKKGLTDMHSFVAILLYPELLKELNKTLDEITNDDLTWVKTYHHDKRQIAKTAEFAIGYGGNGATIAKNTGCSPKQGEEVYNQYFKAFSGMKSYFDLVLAKALHFGYIEYNSITKRKFFISPDNPVKKYKEDAEANILPWPLAKEYREAMSELQRLAQNYPIQGSSADISKLAGVFFFNEILNRGWFNIVKIVNMVHDEYNIEAPADLIDEAVNVLRDCMRKAGTFFCKTVSLDAEAEIGDFWIH